VREVEEGPVPEPLFFAFDRFDCSSLIGSAAVFQVDWNGVPETDARVILWSRELLRIRPGRGIKGPYAGVDTNEIALLPGGRYFFLAGPRTLLFDLETGEYRELPEDTTVYPQIDSEDLGDPVITSFGVRGDLDLSRLR
jgi:hypothetical protein